MSLILVLLGFNANSQITAPFIESFNAGFPAATWNQSATTGGPWITGGTMGYNASSIADHTGTAGSTFTWLDYSGTDAGVIMMSDTIDVSLVPKPELSFWFNNNLGTNPCDPFNPLFIEGYDGTSWVVIDLLQQDNLGVWSEHYYDLCSFVMPGNKVLIRFRAEPGATISGSRFFHDLAIDDISVDTLRVNCFQPQALRAESITNVSATLKWATGCSDTAWSVKYDLTGFDPATAGTYVHVNVDSLAISSLTDLTDYDFYVRSYCNLGDTSVWSGPFNFQTLPTCVAPINQSVTDITAFTATLRWDAGAGPIPDTAWSIKYDVAGFVPATAGTYVHVNVDSLNIASLLAVTNYEFYVRGYCNSGDTSAWVGPFAFTTTCSFFTPPYLEDFATYTFAVTPSCWTEADGLLSVASSLVFGSSDWTGDAFAGAGSNSARMNIWSTGRNDWLISPTIDLGTGTIPYQVEFDVSLNPWASTSSSTFDPDDKFYLIISPDNGVTWSDTNILEKWDTGNTPPAAGTYFSFDLTAAGYTGQVKFGLYGESSVSGVDNEVYVDNFAVIEIPTCPKPQNLRDIALFSDSVNLTWIQGANDSIWEIQYGTTGFTIGSGIGVASGNDSVGINSLTPSTTYDVYLRSICHVGDTSQWVGPLTFTTPCSFFTPPYSEDFTTMTFATVPGCWEEGTGILTVNSTISTGSSNWGSDGFAQVGFNGAAKLNIWTTNRIDWLISPSIDLGTGAIPYQVEFDIALNAFANTGPPSTGALGPDDKIVLLISPDNGVTWSDTNILRQWDSTDIPSNLGEYFYFDLTAAGYTGQVRLAIYGESTISNEDTDLTIDNFAVVQVPTCPRPLSLVFDSATQTTANISWTNGSADSSWILEYGTPGFTPGSGTTVNSATNPAVIVGLMPSTCYDVYLRSICTVGDTSIQIGPMRFCTDCAPVVDLCEDFEGYSAGELPICWEKFIISTGSSTVQINTFGGSAAPNAVQMNAGNDGGATMFLISPEMTALSAGTHRISFWVDGSFTTDTVLIVGTMSDPANPGTFVPVDTIKTITSSYQRFRIPIPATTDTRVAFQYVATATFRSLTIDDFCFEVTPSCEKAPFPTILNDGVDSTNLNLGWNLDTTQVSFIINHGPTGYDPVTNPAGGVSNTSTFNFFSATGLNPLTEYCFWIKAICSNGDTSAWAGPFCGRTGCPSGVSLPYFEDFTNYTSAFPLDNVPQCWEEAIGTLSASGGVAPGESQWEPDGFANVGFTGAARINFSAFTAREGWLLTPRFNLGTDPNTKRYIEFDIALTEDFSPNAAPNGFGSDDTVAFVMSTNGGVTWSNANILMQWDSSNSPAVTSTHIEYSLDNAIGNVQFGFYGVSNVNNEGVDFFVDNFSIKDTVYAGVGEIDGVTSFKVYPNPNDGRFTILNEGNASKSNVKVLDIQGRVVFEDAHYFNQNARKQVDLTKLNSGVYILILQGEGRQEQHRIIIE